MSTTKARKPRVKASKTPHQASGVSCVECNKKIAARDQALFVEEEVGRYFCSEACIIANFTPEIEKLEREYGKHVSPNDLTSEEREKYAHLRWLTLEQPDEIWREKTTPGDYRYTLISEFKPDQVSDHKHKDQKPVFAVAICLMLQGEPSFLYLAFTTNDRYLIDAFRKGEKLKMIRKNSLDETPAEARDPGENRLAEPWSESDSIQAQILRARKEEDISTQDFSFYQNCLEETLQEPSELWSYLPKTTKRFYHFIRHYTHDQDYWYVVMAKDTEYETQIEIVDAFPTNDEGLIQLCRHGRKEVLGGAQGEATHEEALPEKVRRNVH